MQYQLRGIIQEVSYSGRVAMILKIIICIILGYAFGCFQTGYFLGRKRYGVDVRDYGSHNSGTTNTIRVLGKKAGYIVFFGDALKAVFAIWLVRYLIFPGDAYRNILEMITGLGVVLGHNYPFYMNFKGGKGIAATGGVMFALHWPMALIAFIVFLIGFFVTRYVSVGSLAMSAIFPFMILYFYHGDMRMFFLAIIFTALAWWRHRENIGRLINGTENKFEKKSRK